MSLQIYNHRSVYSFSVYDNTFFRGNFTFRKFYQDVKKTFEGVEDNLNNKCLGFELENRLTSSSVISFNQHIVGFTKVPEMKLSVLPNHKDLFWAEAEILFVWMVKVGFVGSQFLPGLLPDRNTLELNFSQRCRQQIRIAPQSQQYPMCHGFLVKRDARYMDVELKPGHHVYAKRDYDPVTLLPYTVPCPHNGECDRFALIKFAMIRMIATEIDNLPRANLGDVLGRLEWYGWAAAKNRWMEEKGDSIASQIQFYCEVKNWPSAGFHGCAHFHRFYVMKPWHLYRPGFVVSY